MQELTGIAIIPFPLELGPPPTLVLNTPIVVYEYVLGIFDIMGGGGGGLAIRGWALTKNSCRGTCSSVLGCAGERWNFLKMWILVFGEHSRHDTMFSRDAPGNPKP